jgi:PAS domain-containing protein
VGWAAHSRERPGNLLLLACVFFGVGLLDFLHTIAYAGMPDFVTPSGPEKAINFWLAARYLSAFGLLAVAVLPWNPVADASLRWRGLLGVIAVVALVVWVALFRVEWLPRTFIAGQGLTAIKVAAEYGLVALFVASAIFFLRNMRTQQPYDVVGLFAAVSTMALSELFFTLYSNVADIFNLLGHVYKVIAYAFAYKSIFVDNIQAPYQRLNAANRMLEQQIEERTRTQSQLELAASVFSHAREGILITDNQGNIVEVNAMFTQITGYSGYWAQPPHPAEFGSA